MTSQPNPTHTPDATNKPAATPPAQSTTATALGATYAKTMHTATNAALEVTRHAWRHQRYDTNGRRHLDPDLHRHLSARHASAEANLAEAHRLAELLAELTAEDASAALNALHTDALHRLKRNQDATTQRFEAAAIPCHHVCDHHPRYDLPDNPPPTDTSDPTTSPTTQKPAALGEAHALATYAIQSTNIEIRLDTNRAVHDHDLKVALAERVIYGEDVLHWLERLGHDLTRLPHGDAHPTLASLLANNRTRLKTLVHDSRHKIQSDEWKPCSDADCNMRNPPPF
jgi:hypothetical protein